MTQNRASTYFQGREPKNKQITRAGMNSPLRRRKQHRTSPRRQGRQRMWHSPHPAWDQGDDIVRQLATNGRFGFGSIPCSKDRLLLHVIILITSSIQSVRSKMQLITLWIV